MQSTEEQIRQAIESAAVYAADETSVDTVLQNLADGRSQAWTFDGFIVVTSVVAYESHSRLRIAYTAGNMTEEAMAKGLEVLERFAKSVGCTGVEIYGRQGWVRRLKPYGYKQQYAVVLKRI